MATEAQVLANRSNAQKSTGPRTVEGKQKVSQNAVKHGLLAQQAVIYGEDPEVFERHREAMLDELAPVGVMESTLAQRIVGLSWRLKRAERVQNEAFDYLLAKDAARLAPLLCGSCVPEGMDDPNGADVALGRVAVRDFANARSLDRLLMYERRIEHSLYKTMAELRKLRRARTIDPKHKTRRQGLSRREGMTRCAKQSQFPCRPMGATLAGRWWPAVQKQSQFAEVANEREPLRRQGVMREDMDGATAKSKSQFRG